MTTANLYALASAGRSSSAGRGSSFGRGSSRTRFGIALLIAGAAHAALLLGVDLPPRPERPLYPPITINLSRQAELPPTPSIAEDAPIANSAIPLPSSPAPSVSAAASDLPEPVQPPPSRPFAGKSTAELAQGVTTLAAFREYADEPQQRVRRLTVGARTTPEFTYYLDAWRRKIERIGNVNYPGEARSRGLRGSLRLLVTIAADGRLTEVRVLETSGHRVLDEAAVRIVRLAAPYAPFSPKMREAVDVLEIERNWHFRNNRYSS